MDYRRELERVEAMIKRGRTRQLIYPAVMFVTCVLSSLGSFTGLEGGLATAFFLCPLAFYIGYGEFGPFEATIYDGNAPRPGFWARYLSKRTGNGRRVLKLMKAYREELLMKVGGTQNMEKVSDAGSVNRGAFTDL